MPTSLTCCCARYWAARMLSTAGLKWPFLGLYSPLGSVRSRMRSPSATWQSMSIFSVMTCAANVSTRQGPMKHSSGMLSIVAPPGIMCSGASTCVPQWLPMVNSLTSHMSPCLKLALTWL